MLITKRNTSPTHCTPISPSIRVCWTDLVVISLILLVVAYLLFGLPLTARMRKVLNKRRNDSPLSSRTTTISSQHNYRMSPCRQDSQETLVDGSTNSNSGDDKLDFMPQDPFLIVQPSLNDSVLVKQGLVEATTLPPPTHIARDVQGPPSQVVWSGTAFEPSSQRSRSGTGAMLLSPKVQRWTAVFSSKTSRVTKDTKTKTRESFEMEGSRDAVPPPPPAYTPFSLGQGSRTRENDVMPVMGYPSVIDHCCIN